jgi:hypothetical protein
MHLLRKLPPVVESLKSISPQEFDVDGVKAIHECLSEIRKKFVGEVEMKAVIWWDKWAEDNTAALTSATAYKQHLERNGGKNFHNPLAKYLFGLEVPNLTVWNSKLSENTSNINPDFQWPAIIAAATASVTTDFNPHPAEPRQIFIEHTALNNVLQVVNEKIRAYYSSLSTTTKKAAIIIVMHQKVQPTGNILKPASNSTKKGLIETWKQNDGLFLAAVFAPLSPNNDEIVAKHCLNIPDDLNTPICSRLNDMIFNQSILLEVNGINMTLRKEGMNLILQLFRTRNNKIISREINDAFKPSYFMNVPTFTAIYELDTTTPSNLSAIDDQFKNLDVEKIYRMYFPYRWDQTSWGIVILDFNLNIIYYVDHNNVNNLVDPSDDPDFMDFIDKVEVTFNFLITELWRLNGKINDNTWDVSPFPLNGSVCAEHNSGIFIAAIMYFIVQECPVYIPTDQLSNLKKKFALWLIDGSLPM